MNSLRRFRSQCKGSVAMIFAIAAVPLIVGAGLAVDYARALTRRTVLQNKLDGAVLAVSRETVTLTDDQIRTKIRSRVEHVEPGGHDTTDFVLKYVSVARTTPTDGAPEITARAGGTVKTSLMNLIGIKEVNIEVMTSASWDTADIMFVVENSESMSNRISPVKTAINNFITAASKDNSVQIGLMPFAGGVRVPLSYWDFDWILFTGDNDGGGFGADNEDGEDEDGYTPISSGTWTGCLTDRKMPYDVDDTNYKGLNPAGDPNKKYPARTNCLPGETNLQTVYPLKPAQSAFSSLISHVNGMTAPADAQTNLTIGVAWGHALLSEAITPFREARKATTEHHRRILILVSGGQNNFSRWYSTSAQLTQLDAQTTLACRSARNDGIEVYTVNVAGNGTNNTLLRGCAGTVDDPGSANHFFYAPTNADITIAFSTMSQLMVRVPRVTH